MPEHISERGGWGRMAGDDEKCNKSLLSLLDLLAGAQTSYGLVKVLLLTMKPNEKKLY